MATRNIGTLTLDLIAKIGGFESGMEKAARVSKKEMGNVKKHVNDAAKVLAGLGVAGATGLAALTVNLISSGREIENLSRVANESTDSFQRITYGAKRFGVEQEKVADILKDVNDKVGDFLITGAGPMADFFDSVGPKVGVTAEHFKNLSGADALQLYVSSLEKANVSQQEMTFFMEAIASDATLLLPLLKKDGEELKRLGDEAERTGAILSDVELGQLNNVAGNIDILRASFKGMADDVALAALPAISDLTGMLSSPDTIAAAQALGAGIVEAFTAAVGAITTTINTVRFLAEEVAVALNGIDGGDITRLEAELEEMQDVLQSGGLDGRRIRFGGKNGWGEYWNDEELKAEIAKVEAAINQFYDNQEKSTGTRNPVIAPTIAGIEPPASAGEKDQDGSGGLNIKANEAEIAAAERLEALRSNAISQLQQQVDLHGKDTELARVQWELEHGRYAELDAATGLQLERLASELDAKNAIVEANVELERTTAILAEIENGLKTETELLNEEYEKKLEFIHRNLDDKEKAAQLELKIEAEKNKKLRELSERARYEETQAQLVALGNWEDLFGGLAGIAKSAAGEQSNAYRALFALSQGFAVAQAAVSIATGIAKAQELGFPANIGEMGRVISTGAQVYSMINGADFKPASYLGGGLVPDGPRTGGVDGMGGRYAIVHPGEKITDPYAGASGAAVGGAPVVNINNYSTAQVRSEVNELDNSINIFVEDIERNGPRSQALQRRFGLRRVGT